MSARYAVYFSPAPHSAWWDAGAHWLGRDECSDLPLHPGAWQKFSVDDWRALTAAPRRYGFHATLKAPFRLREGVLERDLLRRLQDLADTLQQLALGPMRAVALGNFAALVPSAPSQELEALASRCVTELDDLRAPLSAQDLARRDIESLDTRGVELLQRYGYPHVLERFRLHMSLSGVVDGATVQRVVAAWEKPLAQLNAANPLLLDRLCLFVEAGPGQAFFRIADVLLQYGATARAMGHRAAP